MGLDAYTVIELAKFLTTQQEVSVKSAQRFYDLVDDWLKVAPNNSKCTALMNLVTTSYFIKSNHLPYILRIIEFNY